MAINTKLEIIEYVERHRHGTASLIRTCQEQLAGEWPITHQSRSIVVNSLSSAKQRLNRFDRWANWLKGGIA